VRAQNDPSCINGDPLYGMQAVYSSTESADVSNSSSFNTHNWPSPITFNAGETNGFWGFREPTLLSQNGVPQTAHVLGQAFTDYPTYTPQPNRQVTGLYVTSFPWCNGTNTADVCQKFWSSDNGQVSCLRFYLDYEDASGNWITYDEQPYQPYDSFTLVTWPQATAAQILALQQVATTDYYGGARTDPRTSRWGPMISEYLYAIPMVGGSNSNNEYCTFRPDGGLSYGSHVGGRVDWGIVGGGNSYPKVYRGFQHGYWTENSVRPTYQNLTAGNDPGDNGLRYIRDPDGVPRRAMAGYWSDPANNGNPSPSVTSGTVPAPPVIGLPMATGNYGSRPTILHRPFRSVAELGYVFSDTPWRNLDFSDPESGDAALFDVFCLNENSDPNALVAGRVNLNSRQLPVLQAVTAGGLIDKDDPTNPMLSSSMAAVLMAQLVARTSSTTTTLTSGSYSRLSPIPLTNRADLVGSWNPTVTLSSTAAVAAALSGTADPNAYYSGFSSDIGPVSTGSNEGLFNLSATVTGTSISVIPRQREAVMRALADSGTARVWNLMIDIIAQSGQYKPGAQNLSSDFVVQGERRYWLHVAIDRNTGQILDKQLELVNE
jgi:hypothetical protein